MSAASELGKRRWAGTTAEERSQAMSALAKRRLTSQTATERKRIAAGERAVLRQLAVFDGRPTVDLTAPPDKPTDSTLLSVSEPEASARALRRVSNPFQWKPGYQ